MEIQSTAPARGTQPGNRFDQALSRSGMDPILRGGTTVLQINVGRLCNQACKHCHVEAGPKRTEVMPLRIVERLIELAAEAPHLTTVDLTGGAPEMNPHFRMLVETMRALGKEVIARCNLTILSEPGFEGLPEFYAGQGVHLICSMPCYTEDNVNRQRGKGVFGRSIEGLRALNRQGYGHGQGLVMDLVYNPLGPFLPGDQAGLQADYKQRLMADWGVRFDSLYTLTNLPIGRFAQSLERTGELTPYLELLDSAFNPGTVPELMCRNTLSVGWDGRTFDCDFNQMLDLELEGSASGIFAPGFTLGGLAARPVRTGEHCLGCTAGAGSSCGGALT